MRIKVEESKWSSWRLILGSGCDEYPGCKLNVTWPGKAIYIYLPRIINPRREYHDLLPNIGKDGYGWLKVKEDGTCGYWETFARDYGFSYSDRAIHFYYGKQTMEWPGCKSKCFFIPWLEWRHVRFSLMDLEGNRIWDEPTTGDFRERMKLREEAEKNTPAEVFEFTDYDGERLNVACQVQEREWRRGIGWFKWLSFFSRPMIRRTLDLQFSGETGRRKGSWKGGTLGHSVEIGKGETPESAFRRYCAEHEMTFIGVLPEPA